MSSSFKDSESDSLCSRSRLSCQGHGQIRPKNLQEREQKHACGLCDQSNWVIWVIKSCMTMVKNFSPKRRGYKDGTDSKEQRRTRFQAAEVSTVNRCACRQDTCSGQLSYSPSLQREHRQCPGDLESAPQLTFTKTESGKHIQPSPAGSRHGTLEAGLKTTLSLSCNLRD